MRGDTSCAPCPNPTGIDLENIVYYKDDTHYFVMTAKKQCLLRLGVLRQVGPRPRQGGTEWVQAWMWSPLGVEGVRPVCSGTVSTSISSSLRLTWPRESCSGLSTIYQSQHCTS